MCAKKYLELPFLKFQFSHGIKKDIQEDEGPFKESIMSISTRNPVYFMLNEEIPQRYESSKETAEV